MLCGTVFYNIKDNSFIPDNVSNATQKRELTTANAGSYKNVDESQLVRVLFESFGEQPNNHKYR